jgi:hypothetical protein
MIVLWAEGSRQIGNMISLSAATSSSAITKRGTNPDLEVSTKLTNDLLQTTSFSPAGLFVLLNIFMFASCLLTGLFLSLALGKANGDPSGSNSKAQWWRHPTRPLKLALMGLSRVVSPLLMGSRLHGPQTSLRRSSWKTCLRFFVFALQTVITLLLLRQAISFMFLVNSTSGTYSDLPDISSGRSAISSIAKDISPGMALVILTLLLGVAIITLTAGWYALMNPRLQWPRFTKIRQDTGSKGDVRMILILKLVGAFTIILTFAMLCFFFGQVTKYAQDANIPSGTYNINLLAANGIMGMFALPVVCSLLVIWDNVKGLKKRMKTSSLSCV